MISSLVQYCQQWGGVKEATSVLTDNTIMWISVVIVFRPLNKSRLSQSQRSYHAKQRKDK